MELLWPERAPLCLAGLQDMFLVLLNVTLGESKMTFIAKSQFSLEIHPCWLSEAHSVFLFTFAPFRIPAVVTPPVNDVTYPSSVPKQKNMGKPPIKCKGRRKHNQLTGK